MKDRCPNCGYCIMNHITMLESNKSYRVCPVCTYICRKRDSAVIFEGIPKESLIVREVI